MDASPRPPSDGSPPPPAPLPPAHKHTGSPTDFLKGVVGKRVVVRLTSGVDYRGQPLFVILDLSSLLMLFFKQVYSHAWMDL